MIQIYPTGYKALEGPFSWYCIFYVFKQLEQMEGELFKRNLDCT